MPRSFTKAELLKTYEEHPLNARTILARLKSQKRDTSNITELDLAIDADTEITDQNHIGGFVYDQELARYADVKKDSVVLDAGCGLGGSSRVLAHLYGCRVQGVELTEFRFRDAVNLTRLVGLENLVGFTRGDIMTVELAPKQFDVIVAQASFSHIQDKEALMARCAHLLKEGGRLALEDVCLQSPCSTGEEEQQYCELEDVWKCYFAALDHWLACLKNSGFRVITREDLGEQLREYYSNLKRIFDRSPDFSASADEVKGWERVQGLVQSGVIGYFRIVASLEAPPGIDPG